MNDSNEEHVTAVERNFKCQAQQPIDHFEKFLEVTYPNHAYPIKHKLKECSMMKNYMTMGALTKGKKPEGDPGERPPHPSMGKRWSCQSMADVFPMSPSIGLSIQAGRSTS
jgi:hypothetical protein